MSINLFYGRYFAKQKASSTTMDILKDTLKTPYKQYTIGNVEIQYLENLPTLPM